jgi:hypothetical protein
MAALSTPNTSYIAPAVTSALDQSSFADLSSAYPALDASLNASMDCSLNGSFSEARQSKTKPVIMVTQADKVRRDAEKKAAEVESASALRLDSEAKHKAARERRLQLEEENRRKLEEAEKAKREREAAKQAAVKAQLDEEQRRKREEEEKRKREREHAAAAAEEAKRKEQARAFQKVPAALVASSSAYSSAEISTQLLGTFNPNKTASSVAEQTSISALITPTVVPATMFSPTKTATTSLFGGVKSLISTVGGAWRARAFCCRVTDWFTRLSTQASSALNLSLTRRLPQLLCTPFRLQLPYPRKRLRLWGLLLLPQLQQKKAGRLLTTYPTIATGMRLFASRLLAPQY